MITIHHIDKLLESEYIHFDYSKQFLTVDEIFFLEKVNGMRFYFENDLFSTEFDSFLKKCLLYFIEINTLYFVYLEPYASARSKIRSYRKLFYDVKTEIGAENVAEVEVPIGTNESRLSAVVKITKQNLNFITAFHFNSAFVFGYITDKNLLVDTAISQSFLKSLIEKDLNQDKTSSLNLLKSINRLINAQDVLLTIATDGKNNQSINFFGMQPYLNGLSQILEERFNTHLFLQK